MSRPPLLIVMYLLLATTALAQSRDVAPCMPAAPTCGPSSDAPDDAVATLDGAVIRVADLDDATRKRLEGLDAAVADARRKAMRQSIDDLLFDLEASRRGVTTRDLLYNEISAKAVRPTEAEIAAEIAAHPERYKSGAEDSDRAAATLLDRSIRAREAEFIAEVETRFPVKLVTDPSAAQLAPDTVLATVGKRRLLYRDAKSHIDALAAEEHLKAAREGQAAVDQLVHQRLLEAEARRRGIDPAELVRVEVAGKIVPPTNAELQAEWEKSKEAYGPDFEKARNDVQESLIRRRKNAAEQAFEKNLRAGHPVTPVAAIPMHPRQRIEVGDAPARGNANARVTLVEWGDFQCPPCGRIHPIVEEALEPYGDRVRFVFRQNPLNMHRYAWKAAEASLAAHAQGRFFEYKNILFHHQNALDVDSLKRYATEAGLDRKRFDRDLDSGRFAAGVYAEIRQGARLGVLGTPVFFVNGVKVDSTDYGVEGFRRLIDAALAR